MQDETSAVTNPIGLYRDPISGKEVGALEPVMADAFVQLGFQLVTEGRDAAMKTQAEMDADANPPEHDTSSQSETDSTDSGLGSNNSNSGKKGSK